jgi:hypothetical protein
LIVLLQVNLFQKVRSEIPSNNTQTPRQNLEEVEMTTMKIMITTQKEIKEEEAKAVR